jgi:hypothetical protein
MTLPELHLADWRATRDTLQPYSQIVGKVRLATTAPRNHWWNVPLYNDVRGLTTRRLHHHRTTFDGPGAPGAARSAALGGRVDRVRLGLVGDPPQRDGAHGARPLAPVNAPVISRGCLSVPRVARVRRTRRCRRGSAHSC